MKDKQKVTITGLSHEGRGIARLAGKTVFIEGGLPGEIVEIELVKRKARFDEAKIVNFIEQSAQRNVPECDFFEICGGCSLQHMSSVAQIEHKQAVMLEQLLHIGGIIPGEVLKPITAKTYGYRRKARLGVRYVDKKQKLLIGFREKNGRYLADIESCSVLHPSIGTQLPLIREFLLTLQQYRQIPQIEVAVGEDHSALILRHLVPLLNDDLEKIEQFAKLNGYHIYLQPGGSETVNLLYPKNIDPRLHYGLENQNLEMRFHPTDFTQVNLEINKQLIELAIDLLAPDSKQILLDLFCGIGNFTLPLAKKCKQVIGIEGSDEMVKRGYENAAHNQITNVAFYCENLAATDYNNSWLTQQIDGILLDPPRAGAWEIISKIPATLAKRIVYISCNPATFARDAGFLTANGFALAKAGVLDMFPHTSHVESIALFIRD